MTMYCDNCKEPIYGKTHRIVLKSGKIMVVGNKCFKLLKEQGKIKEEVKKR